MREKQKEALEKHGKRRGGFLCESSSSAKKGNSGAGANATGSGFTIRLLQSANLVRFFIDFDGNSLLSSPLAIVCYVCSMARDARDRLLTFHTYDNNRKRSATRCDSSSSSK